MHIFTSVFSIESFYSCMPCGVTFLLYNSNKSNPQDSFYKNFSKLFNSLHSLCKRSWKYRGYNAIVSQDRLWSLAYFLNLHSLNHLHSHKHFLALDCVNKSFAHGLQVQAIHHIPCPAAHYQIRVTFTHHSYVYMYAFGGVTDYYFKSSLRNKLEFYFPADNSIKVGKIRKCCQHLIRLQSFVVFNK